MKPGEKRGRGEVVWIESDGVREEREKEREKEKETKGGHVQLENNMRTLCDSVNRLKLNSPAASFT